VPVAIPNNDAAVAATISSPRIATYLAAAGGNLHKAVALYGWNARISAALILPAHFAEVAVRNAVDDALTHVYGSRWPWSAAFERSLPNGGGPFYSPRRDLLNTRARHVTTGKVIAELKFVFWQNMFTARHDGRIWAPSINPLFPGSSSPAKLLRQGVYDDLEATRKIRNRIAHHEPIFTRDLPDDLRRMLELVSLRCAETGAWLKAMEDATATLTERP